MTLTDDFNRSNGDLGANWQVTSGNVVIASTKLSQTAGGYNWGSHVAQCEGDNQFAQIVCSTPASHAGCSLQVACRLANNFATQTFYALHVDLPSQQYGIFKFIDGTFTRLTLQTGPTYASGDVLRLECEGSTIRGLVNGVHIPGSPLTDTDIIGVSFRRVGFGIASDGLTAALMDDWTAGDFGLPIQLTKNLSAYWKLEEPFGDRVDSAGGNTLNSINAPMSAAGKINTAAQFLAINSDTLTCADNAALSTGDIDFTFACWVKPSTLTGYPCVAAKGWLPSSNPNREWILYLDSSINRLVFGVEGSAEGGVTSSVVLSAQTWYFVACWHDAVNNQLGIAINNGTPDTVAHATGVHEGSGAFWLGSSDPTHFIYWDGLIDEAGFWKRVLSSDDRTELWNSGIGLSYPFTGVGAFSYASSAKLNLSLSGLAHSAAPFAGVVCDAIDNESQKFLEVIIQARFKLQDGTPGVKHVYLYVYGSEDGTTSTDEVPLVAGPYTMRSDMNWIQLQDISVEAQAGTGLVFHGDPVPLSPSFGGVIPRKWGLFFLNNSTLPLTVSETDHAVTYTGTHILNK